MVGVDFSVVFLNVHFRPVFLLACVAVLLIGTTQPLPAADTVVFVHDTHMHGGLEGPSIFVQENPPETTPLNAANYFGLVEGIRERRGENYVRMLGGGDDLIGGLQGWEFLGNNMVDAFNAGGLDYNTYGNHEFDAGPAVVRRRIDDSNFQWVSANVVTSADSEVFGRAQGADSFALETINGVRVGFTGFVQDTAPQVTLFGHRAGPLEKVDVRDPVAALSEVVPAMKAAGAEVVVVMNHGGSQPGHDDVRRVARNVNDIDLIVGDHDDTVTCTRVPGTPFCAPEYINGATIILIGDEYLHLGETLFRVDADGNITDSEVIRHDLLAGTDAVTGDSITPDPVVDAVMDTYLQPYHAKYLDTVGRTLVPFDARHSTLWTGESALGDFYADATRPVFDADASLHLPFLWSDTQYPAGPLHHLDIYRTFSVAAIFNANVFEPVPDLVVKMELTGDSLAQLMGFALSQDPPNPFFPMTSGMWYAFDPHDTRPSQRATHIYVDGQPLDRSQTYEIATKSFMARPEELARRVGSAPDSLPPALTETVGKARILNDRLVSVQEVIVDKIRREDPIEPNVVGRVSVVTETGPARFGDSVTLTNGDLGRGAPEAAPPFELTLRVDSGAAPSTPVFSIFALGPTHPKVTSLEASKGGGLTASPGGADRFDTNFQVVLNVSPDTSVDSDSIVMTIDANGADTAGFGSFRPAVYEPGSGWKPIAASRVLRRDGAQLTFRPPHFSSFAVVGRVDGDGGGSCLMQRAGMPDGLNEALRGLRDRMLPTSPGRWMTAVYYGMFGRQ